jgi:hypothetical protein
MLADLDDRLVQHLPELVVAGFLAQLAHDLHHLAVGGVIVLKFVDVEILQGVDGHRSLPFRDG